LSPDFGVVKTDERMYHFNRVLSLPAVDTTVFVHPRMFPIHNMAAEHGTASQSGEIILPPSISLSGEKLESTGAYLIDNGESILVLIGRDCNQSFLEQAFGIHQLGENEAGRLYFENKGNPLSQKVGIQPVNPIESKPTSAPFFDVKAEVAPDMFHDMFVY
jgi:protein transport protein SEC24